MEARVQADAIAMTKPMLTIGTSYSAIRKQRKNKMLTQQALANKRRAKALKRKNKQYTGPKYSRLEMLMPFFPLMEKAGIIKVEQEEPNFVKGKTNILDNKTGNESSTSFTQG